MQSVSNSIRNPVQGFSLPQEPLCLVLAGREGDDAKLTVTQGYEIVGRVLLRPTDARVIGTRLLEIANGQ